METYLDLFEQVIKKQIEVIGKEKALNQAKKAGLGVSQNGHIVSCTGNPQIVLLRLIKHFTAGGNLLALTECTPLINKLLKDYNDKSEKLNTLKEEIKT